MSVVFAVGSDENADSLSWYSAGDDAARPFDEEEITARDAVIIVSGRDVFTGEIDVVARSEKELRTAALFQLEDELGQPPSDLHIALGQKQAQLETRPVAIVSQTQMEAWAEAFSGLKTSFSKPVRIVPDTSLLTKVHNSLLYDGDGEVLLFTPKGNFSIERDLAPDLLHALIQDLEVHELDYVSGSDACFPNGVAGLVYQSTDTASYRDFIAQNLREGQGIDLRQAEFRIQQKMDLGFASKWVKTGAMAACLLVGWFAYLGISANRLNAETDRLYQTSLSAYQALYPNEANNRDPHTSTMAKLSGAGAQSSQPIGVSALLSAVYTSIESVDGVEIEDLSYNQDAGRLSSRLKFASFEARDDIRRAMEAQGLRVDLPGVSQEDGFLVGQLVLETAQ